MTRHTRLQRTMRSPVRVHRAAKHRPSAQRARAYAAYRVPLSALFDLIPPFRPQRRSR